MTQEIADVLGSAAVPYLEALLADPKFTRHDNVVAYLGYLSRTTDTVQPLLAFAQSVSASPSTAATMNPDKVLVL